MARPKLFTRTGFDLVCEFNVDCGEEAEALVWTKTDDDRLALSLACPRHTAEIALGVCRAS